MNVQCLMIFHKKEMKINFHALIDVRGKYNDINDDLEYKKPLNSFSI